MTKTYRGDLPDQEGDTPLVFHHDVLNIVYRPHLAITPDEVALVGFLNIRTARYAVVCLQRVEDLHQRDTRGNQARGIDRNLILFQVTAPAVDLHHPGDAGESSSDHPVLNGTQVGSCVMIFIRLLHIERILIDFTKTGGDRPHLRCAKSLGNLRRGTFDLLGNQLPRQVGPHGLIEDDGHQRDAELGDRSDLLHARQVGHLHLHRCGDVLLDLLRGEIAGGGDHLHLVVGDVGYRSHGDIKNGIYPEGSHGEGE